MLVRHVHTIRCILVQEYHCFNAQGQQTELNYYKLTKTA